MISVEAHSCCTLSDGKRNNNSTNNKKAGSRNSTRNANEHTPEMHIMLSTVFRMLLNGWVVGWLGI